MLARSDHDSNIFGDMANPNTICDEQIFKNAVQLITTRKTLIYIQFRIGR